MVEAHTVSSWTSSAPANLMLMGEHSVVYGQNALACSLTPRIHIEWQRRSDREIHIDSALACFKTDLSALADHPKLTWVMACLKSYQLDLHHGLNLTIRAEFESTLGLGSSAALLAALLGGLDAICGKHPTFNERFARGLRIIHQLQGRGSGTDLAASLSGGVILFNPKKQSVNKLDLTEFTLDCQLLYSGYKTPTAEVLNKVAETWQHQESLLDDLYHLMGKTTEAAYQALKQQKLSDFYHLINTYQGLMDALGVNDQTLSHLIYQLRAEPQILASKISGSGLGDCVLAFGRADLHQNPAFKDFPQIDFKISSQGLLVEPIATQPCKKEQNNDAY